jgi:hypothetical protein
VFLFAQAKQVDKEESLHWCGAFGRVEGKRKEKKRNETKV